MPPSAQTMLSMAASTAASVMLVRTIANDLLPRHVQDLLFSSLRSIFDSFSSDLTIIIDEFNGFSTNKLYTAAQMYLGSKISPSDTRRLRVSKDDSDKDISISMERGETVVDVFQGVRLEWKFIRLENQKNVRHSYDDNLSSTVTDLSHSFYLTFHKRHKDRVLQSYLPHVLAQAKAMMDEKKTQKLYTVDYETMRVYGRKSSPWKSVNLNHPATFSTVAMDAGAKEALMEDLERFLKRKEFYRRVGKAWKRGYLLYGPPGTGKSSLIAAMANFLNFDVYDLELTDIERNSDLRRILIATANRSILVIEDIDCSADFKDRNEPAEDALEPVGRGKKYREEKRITLSGLLNFIDGLWSSCGDERIIVFTTNHKDKLDPALLRPGRMDMHIHMSYCSFSGFETLAQNYHTVDDHPSFRQIKQLLMEVEVTPAQVAEELMKSDDPDAAFRGFIEFLARKKMEDEEEAKSKSKEEVEHEDKKPEVDNE